MRNSAGTPVVNYSYDAWGNPISTTGSMANTLGVLNPLRYRGYVYDQETGLYYLQSRYYNPEWGRFISADAFVSTGQGILGNNMFAYCQNNPVMRCDPSGHWSWGWQERAALGTTMLIAGIALLLAAPTGGSSLVLGGLALSSAAVLTAGSSMAFIGTIILGDATAQATVSYAKTSKKSGKEKANDHPSWMSRSDVDLNKSAHQNATDLLNNKWGSGNWKKGPKSEYNQIVKWIDRGLKAIILLLAEDFMQR